jgi:hypothetical protein
VSIDDLRLVIDSWEAQTARTRQKVTSVIRAFWSWAEEQGHIALSPRRPDPPAARRTQSRARPPPRRARPPARPPHRSPATASACSACSSSASAAPSSPASNSATSTPTAAGCASTAKARRNASSRSAARSSPNSASPRQRPPPRRRPPQGDDYLLYPVRRYADGKGTEGQIRVAYRGFPKDRPSPQAVHRWWYRHAQAAGLVGPGVTSGLNMHRARHTFAMELRRVAGIDAASHALGHSDLSTTLGIYGHRDDSDLERAMEPTPPGARTSQAFPPKQPENADN